MVDPVPGIPADQLGFGQAAGCACCLNDGYAILVTMQAVCQGHPEDPAPYDGYLAHSLVRPR